MFDIFYSGEKPNLFAHEQAVDTIEQAQQHSRTRFFWFVNYLSDYSSFDFLWEPVPWESTQRHAWASQHQADSGTYLVPTMGYTDTNYHTDIRIRKLPTAVYEIDHLDGNAGQIANTVKTARYFDNYLDTLKRLANSVPEEQEYIWICSSVCDYTDFDFSWHPDAFQNRLLHVFASDENKFGDTFYMHVASFKHKIHEFELLDWYDLNFADTAVPRRSLPVIRHNNDSQVDAVKTQNWQGPLAVFAAHDQPIGDVPTVSLWRDKTKTIVPLNASGSTVIVPRVAISYVKEQLYDYPYIDKTHKYYAADKPLDVVFISNGEANAEPNWVWLKWALSLENRHSETPNRVVRVNGVNGRVAAYQAAANASTTDWFFAVFAKLSVDVMFDWHWQPDMMQQSKHYIFHAKNPCNGLVYGHQAMIAYNKKLVLENTGAGLDFTMDQLHEVVPVTSGTAHYTDTPWMAWRTAFREVLKLKQSLPDVENEYRLNKWLGSEMIDPVPAHSEWSRIGAEDAMEYYNEVNGEFAALKKSYEWEWLASYAFMKRNILPE
jgi:hypothetical protein